MDKNELRKLFRELTYLKENDRLAKGALSGVIRDARRNPSLQSPALDAYAEENIGLGANGTQADRQLFAARKNELLGRIRGELVALGDESWVGRFETD